MNHRYNFPLPRQPRPVLLVFLLGLTLLLPWLTPMGMFLDGIVYASLAMNLADGIGSLWALKLNDSYFANFVEHPPLGIALQVPLFWIFGDHYLVEKLYGLITLAVAAVLIRKHWLQATKHSTSKTIELWPFWWLPLGLWVLIPKWSWAYRNNLLDNSLLIFCLLTVWLQLRAFGSDCQRGRAVLAVVAATSTLSGFLIKGPVSLFVLTAPMFLWLIQPPAAKGVLFRTLAFYYGTIILGFAALWLYPASAETLAAYFERHIFSSLSHQDGFCTGGECLYIVSELLRLLILPIFATSIALFMLRRRMSSGWWRRSIQPALGYLAIGMSASLPIALSSKQSTHYLLPSIPFYLLALALVLSAALAQAGANLNTKLERRPSRRFLAVFSMLIVIVLVISLGRIGQIRKSQDYYHDLALVAEAVEAPVVVGIQPEMYNDWYLHNIAWRHHRIELNPDPERQAWLLLDSTLPSPDHADWDPQSLQTHRWKLYKRRTNN